LPLLPLVVALLALVVALLPLVVVPSSTSNCPSLVPPIALSSTFLPHLPFNCYFIHLHAPPLALTHVSDMVMAFRVTRKSQPHA